MSNTSNFGLPSSHGAYIYNKAKRVWSPLSNLYRVGEKFAIVYFKNTKCSACREFDKHWTRFVEIASARYTDTDFYLVICGWFAEDCDSNYAKALFQKYDIYASPSVLFLHSDGRNEKIIERISGVLSFKQLELIYEIIRVLASGLSSNVFTP